MQSWFNQWSVIENQWLPLAIVAALLPVALAIFSRRLTVLFATIVLEVVSVSILIAPSDTVVVAIGFYLGSLIMAVLGITARQKVTALNFAIDRLQQDVNALSRAEEQRFLNELKQQERVSTVPPRTDASVAPTHLQAIRK